MGKNPCKYVCVEILQITCKAKDVEKLGLMPCSSGESMQERAGWISLNR